MALNPCLTDKELVEVMKHGEIRLAEVQNPITRSVVRLNPPLKCTDAEAFKEFTRYFHLWCEAMWMLGREDPEEITAKWGWLADDAHTSLLKSATQE